MTDAIQFDCRICGWHVTSHPDAPGADTSRCAVCESVARLADPLERAELQALLARQEQPNA